ncbi:LysR family glycine cleavage system transcriptional activator [Bradyrhizobium yuanmingense]|uniref:LysR family transcriptional regulator n=1 Tax=Bradyrhizobium yuanmingense TaxID=108015 RepID=UPI003512498D
MKLPPLQALRSFEAVARRGSVTRAAEELHVSHAAVSYQLHKLEEWIGLPLVERNGRGIRLTEAGERYKLKICAAFGTIHDETELLRGRQTSPLVRVSCLPMFAVSWLMPQMHDFWGKHPDIRVAIQYSRMTDRIDPATVDVAIRYGNLDEFPDFLAMPLLEGLTIPVASPEYLQHVGYKDMNDLPRLTLLHDDSRIGWQEWLRQATADYNLDPSLADSGTIYPDGNLALSACLAGKGALVLVRDAALFHLRANTLIPLSSIGIRRSKFYLVLTPRSRPLPRSALFFAQWMQSLPGTIKLGVPKS